MWSSEYLQNESQVTKSRMGSDHRPLSLKWKHSGTSKQQR